jgi:hypothetical protein
MPGQLDRRTVTGDQLAADLQTSRRTLRRSILRGEIPPPDICFGRTLRWSRGLAEEILRSRGTKTNS